MLKGFIKLSQFDGDEVYLKAGRISAVVKNGQDVYVLSDVAEYCVNETIDEVFEKIKAVSE